MSSNTLIERLNEHASYLRAFKDEGQTMIERQCIAVMSEAAQALAQFEAQQAAGEANKVPAEWYAQSNAQRNKAEALLYSLKDALIMAARENGTMLVSDFIRASAEFQAVIQSTHCSTSEEMLEQAAGEAVAQIDDNPAGLPRAYDQPNAGSDWTIKLDNCMSVSIDGADVVLINEASEPIAHATLLRHADVPDGDTLLSELADALEDAKNNGFGEAFFRTAVNDLIGRARKALAAPQPEAPAEVQQPVAKADILKRRFPYVEQQDVNRAVTVHWFDVLRAIDEALATPQQGQEVEG